jgi:hypothetical protein
VGASVSKLTSKDLSNGGLAMLHRKEDGISFLHIFTLFLHLQVFPYEEYPGKQHMEVHMHMNNCTSVHTFRVI